MGCIEVIHVASLGEGPKIFPKLVAAVFTLRF